MSQTTALSLRLKKHSWCNFHSTRQSQRPEKFRKQSLTKCFCRKFIKLSLPDWAAPTVFALRKDGSPRFYFEYQKLSAVTERDSYSIPHIDEFIDSLLEAVVISTSHANSCHWASWCRRQQLQYSWVLVPLRTVQICVNAILIEQCPKIVPMGYKRYIVSSKTTLCSCVSRQPHRIFALIWQPH